MGGVLALFVSTLVLVIVLVFAVGLSREHRGGRPASCLQSLGCGCSVALLLLAPVPITLLVMFSHFVAMGDTTQGEWEREVITALVIGLLAAAAGLMLAYFSVRRARDGRNVDQK